MDIVHQPKFWVALINGYAETVNGVGVFPAPAVTGRWYNGYHWTGKAVYNPLNLLLLFDKREFRPWWFETGTPTFLVNLLAERGFFTPDLARMRTGMDLLSTFDVEHIATEALLFQTGYLTLHHAEELIREY